jgi:hypothetical protein
VSDNGSLVDSLCGAVPVSSWRRGGGSCLLGDDPLNLDAVLAHPLVDGHAMNAEFHGRLGDRSPALEKRLAKLLRCWFDYSPCRHDYESKRYDYGCQPGFCTIGVISC